MLCVILKMKNGKVLNNNILEIPLNFSNLFTNQKVYVDPEMKILISLVIQRVPKKYLWDKFGQEITLMKKVV